MSDPKKLSHWSWNAPYTTAGNDSDRLKRAFVNCFGGSDGAMVLQHLHGQFIERRVGQTAPDAQLRHVEGQRDAVAYIIRMARPNSSPPSISETEHGL